MTIGPEDRRASGHWTSSPPSLTLLLLGALAIIGGCTSSQSAPTSVEAVPTASTVQSEPDGAENPPTGWDRPLRYVFTDGDGGLGGLKLISRVAGLAGGLVQAAGWYWLMSPAQVVCRWIGWPGLIGVTR